MTQTPRSITTTESFHLTQRFLSEHTYYPSPCAAATTIATEAGTSVTELLAAVHQFHFVISSHRKTHLTTSCSFSSLLNPGPALHLVQRFLSERHSFPSSRDAALTITAEAGGSSIPLHAALRRFRFLTAPPSHHSTATPISTHFPMLADQPPLISATQAADILRMDYHKLRHIQRTTGNLPPDALAPAPHHTHFFFEDRVHAHSTGMLTLFVLPRMLDVTPAAVQRLLHTAELLPDRITPHGRPLFSRRLCSTLPHDHTSHTHHHKPVRPPEYLTTFEATRFLSITPTLFAQWVKSATVLPDDYTASGAPLFSRKKLHIYRSLYREHKLR